VRNLGVAGTQKISPGVYSEPVEGVEMTTYLRDTIPGAVVSLDKKSPFVLNIHDFPDRAVLASFLV
jgi:hypothetical protein